MFIRLLPLFLPILTWGTAFDLGQSTRCVPIPRDMSMCQDVGYSEMRLPNFLGHMSLEAEVVPRSEDWRALVQTGCHPQVRAFLCSLLAPVCLDTFIQPCRSLCMAVKNSCAPVLTCQGQGWPESLDCERFPAHEDMCLLPVFKYNSFFSKGVPRPACQDCPTTVQSPALKTLVDALCFNSFAIKARVSRRRAPSGETEFQVEGRVEFVRQGPLLPYDTQSMLQRWFLINLPCAQALIRPGRSQLYLMAGGVRADGTLILNSLFSWHKKDTHLALTTRKWNVHRC